MCLKDRDVLPLLLMPHLDTPAHSDPPVADTVEFAACSMGPTNCQGITDTERGGLAWLSHHGAKPEGQRSWPLSLQIAPVHYQRHCILVNSCKFHCAGGRIVQESNRAERRGRPKTVKTRSWDFRFEHWFEIFLKPCGTNMAQCGPPF